MKADSPPAADKEVRVFDYASILKISSEREKDGAKRLFEFSNISAFTLKVKLIPCKYRPYLNEFDAIPEERYTREGYDDYLEFDIEPGDIMWREFVIAPAEVWKLKTEVYKYVKD